MSSDRKDILKELRALQKVLLAEERIQNREKTIVNNISRIENLKKVAQPSDYASLDVLFQQLPFFYTEHQFDIESQKKIDKIKEEFDDLFPRKYYDRIGDIINCIEEFRADSVKEAISVILQQDILNEQMRYQREQMEEQTRLIREQLESARETERKRETTIVEFCQRCGNSNYCSHYGEKRLGCYSHY